MRRRFAVLAGAVIAALTLSGCIAAGGAPKSSVSAEDLLGTWGTNENAQLSLEIRRDGTFSARGWPSNLGCLQDKALSIRDVNWADLRSFDGDWALGPDGYESNISFRTDVGDCKGFFSLDLWEANGSVVLREWLGEDPDSTSEGSFFDLSRDR